MSFTCVTPSTNLLPILRSNDGGSCRASGAESSTSNRSSNEGHFAFQLGSRRQILEFALVVYDRVIMVKLGQYVQCQLTYWSGLSDAKNGEAGQTISVIVDVRTTPTAE